MVKGLKYQSLREPLSALLLAVLLCSAQTVLAEDKATATPDHSASSSASGTGSERKAPTVEEKIETILGQAPAQLLTQITRVLSGQKPDLSAEEFKAAIDEAMKKLGEEQATEAETVAEELKKTFEEGRDALGEKPGAEVSSAVVDELERRLEKPAPPTETPTKPGEDKPTDKPTENANNPNLAEEFKKQLADFQKNFNKLKDKNKEDEQKAKDARLAELLKGLGDKGKGGGSGGDAGGKTGGGSGGGNPGGQPSDSGGEDEPLEQPPAQDNSRSAELLRALSDQIKSAEESTPEAEPEEESAKSSDEREPKSDDEDSDILSELAKNDLEDEPLAPVTPVETPQPEVMGPPVLPAKTSLPVIADERRLPSVPESQIGGNPQGIVTGSGSSSGSSSGGSSFSDGAFAVDDQIVGPQKKITYKYLRVGPEAYINGTGTNAEGSVASDGSYSSSSSYTSKAMVGGIPAIFDSGAEEASVGSQPVAQQNVPVFDYVTATVQGMCTNGSLSCSTSMEKQQ